jgi:hypothetical protein
MPPNIPTPEECDLQETIYTREATREGVDERLKSIYKTIIEVGLCVFLYSISLIVMILCLGAGKESDSLETGEIT